MNRLWVSSLSLAGVVGSGGAAWASLSDPGVTSAPPAVAPGTSVVATTASTAAPSVAPSTVSYQVGAAGVVTVDLGASGATVTAMTPGAGWSLGAAQAVGAHLEVIFTDPLQVVTFSADLVDGALVPSVTAVAQPGAPAPAPVAVTQISGSAPTTAQAATPQAATPPAAAPVAQATQPAAAVNVVATPAPVALPAPSATTAPSGGDDDHDDDEDDDHGDDDHDDDHEDGDDD